MKNVPQWKTPAQVREGIEIAVEAFLIQAKIASRCASRELSKYRERPLLFSVLEAYKRFKQEREQHVKSARILLCLTQHGWRVSGKPGPKLQDTYPPHVPNHLKITEEDHNAFPHGRHVSFEGKGAA